MTKFIYAVYDSSAQSYGDPLIFVTDAVAARGFRMEAENKDSLISKFPTDFTLKCIAEFDTVTGDVQPVDRIVCRGTDFIDKE